MTDETSTRTKTEAGNDLAYEIRLHERHVRLFKRVRLVLGLIALCGGASAFAEFFAGNPLLRGVGGLVVAACAFAEVLGDFASKTHLHEAARKRYLKLQARFATLSLDEVDAEMSVIAEEDPGAIEALRRPAFNDMLRTRGYHEYVESLGRVERLLDAIA